MPRAHREAILAHRLDYRYCRQTEKTGIRIEVRGRRNHGLAVFSALTIRTVGLLIGRAVPNRGGGIEGQGSNVLFP